MVFGDQVKERAVGMRDEMRAEEFPDRGVNREGEDPAHERGAFGVAAEIGEGVEAEPDFFPVAERKIGACESREHEVGTFFLEQAAEQVGAGEGIAFVREGFDEQLHPTRGV